MRNSPLIRRLTLSAAVIGTVTALPAMAQESDISLSANAAVVTQYRFRGVDRSGGDIAVQGGVDASHTSGFYVGAWASSLDDDSFQRGDVELDIYGGWSGEIRNGLTVNAGVMAYLFPDAKQAQVALTGRNVIELYGSLAYTLGPAQAKLGTHWAPAQDSIGRQDNLYLYGELSSSVPGTPVTLTGRLGYTDGPVTYTDEGDAFDWSIAASVALDRRFSVGVSYVGAQGDYLPGEYRFTRDAVLGSLSVNF
ncbi:hypothetical protein GRI97_03695 [Altererythrobacter xixiisoli]|uniref:Uncharacterized protein n=1 Tax=Croceibacterium xixiisoli TaxID=1476466 RepID=A0A6I4TSG0_9SPHN|nr:TorF family putative porin [Croceibacterium xixiisoli]MXO98090.1 hypothetical protein [Croceibacterium xixiisoli]